MESKIKFKAFTIEALTNMHVGSGDTQYGVVDKTIQKDLVLQIPVIHSSGVKGALKYHFEYVSGDNSDIDLEFIFGNEYRKSDENEEGEKSAENKDNKKNRDRSSTPGNFIFFDARLLTLPLRATDKVYYHCTSKTVLIECITEILSYVDDSNLTKLKEWVGLIDNTPDQDFLTFEESNNLTIEDFDNRDNLKFDKSLYKNF